MHHEDGEGDAAQELSNLEIPHLDGGIQKLLVNAW